MRYLCLLFFCFSYVHAQQREIASGVVYEHIVCQEPILSIHVLRVDPTCVSIRPLRALDPHGEVLSQMADKADVFCAVNAGFFRIDEDRRRIPAGILKVDGRFFGRTKASRGAIAWSSDLLPLFDRVVLERRTILPILSPDQKDLWKISEYVVGGAGLLIKDGKVRSDLSSERLCESFYDRHARTVVGTLPDRRWVFVLVDGGRSDYSVGMTLSELCGFLVSLGCQNGLNLDGGGSSSMYVRGSIVNLPYGDKDDDEGKACERRITDAIGIWLKR